MLRDLADQRSTLETQGPSSSRGSSADGTVGTQRRAKKGRKSAMVSTIVSGRRDREFSVRIRGHLAGEGRKATGSDV